MFLSVCADLQSIVLLHDRASLLVQVELSIEHGARRWVSLNETFAQVLFFEISQRWNVFRKQFDKIHAVVWSFGADVFNISGRINSVT